jgi:hypothetical protein
VETPVNDTPKLDDADSASFSDRARQRLRKIGAVIASIAAVGAVVSGLSGYWNFWKTVKTQICSMNRRWAANLQRRQYRQG